MFWLPLCLLDLWPPGCCTWFSLLISLSLPPTTWPSSGWWCPPWTLPDVPAYDYTLPHIHSEPSPPPHRGAVRSFPFNFFSFPPPKKQSQNYNNRKQVLGRKRRKGGRRGIWDGRIVLCLHWGGGCLIEIIKHLDFYVLSKWECK